MNQTLAILTLSVIADSSTHASLVVSDRQPSSSIRQISILPLKWLILSEHNLDMLLFGILVFMIVSCHCWKLLTLLRIVDTTIFTRGNMYIIMTYLFLPNLKWWSVCCVWVSQLCWCPRVMSDAKIRLTWIFQGFWGV